MAKGSSKKQARPEVGKPGPEHQRARPSTRPLNGPVQRTEPRRLSLHLTHGRCSRAIRKNCTRCPSPCCLYSFFSRAGLALGPKAMLTAIARAGAR
jgi:hypothetical protein